jgi:hypothetical protein
MLRAAPEAFSFWLWRKPQFFQFCRVKKLSALHGKLKKLRVSSNGISLANRQIDISIFFLILLFR